MGAFVLGVLVGWLAEWVFFTFWVKSDEVDSSALNTELLKKDQEIDALKKQLASVASNTQSTSVPIDKQHSKSNVEANVITSKVDIADNSKETSVSSKAKKAAKKTNVTATKTKKSSTPKLTGDDFTKLSGIGPSLAGYLNKIGIDTFEQLANTDDDTLRDKLVDAGAKMNNNKEIMDTWNEQAGLAAKGEFDALKVIQEKMKS